MNKLTIFSPSQLASTEFWCIHNLTQNKILIACKFTVCKFENSQSETHLTQFTGPTSDCEAAMSTFFGLLIGQKRVFQKSSFRPSGSLFSALHNQTAENKGKLKSFASRSDHKFIVTNAWAFPSPCKVMKQRREWMKNTTEKFIIHSNMIIQECARARWIYSSVRLAGS